MDEGTGIVHIAPGCGSEDFELGVREGLATIVPVDESGAFYEGFGWLHGRHTGDAAQQIIEDLGQRGRMVEAGEITHRYPVCWRCGTELIYRLVDEWFIRCDEVREPMIEAARGVEWTPPQYGKRMEDWLRNMGDWCISRKRYWGLPLPFYFCEDGHMTVIGSRERAARAGHQRAGRPGGAAPALDRRRRASTARVRQAAPSACSTSATAGSTPASCRSRRWAGTTPSSSSAAMRPARPRASPSPTSAHTRTGRPGSRPTGCPRCASRSGSGSTRCCS